MISTKPSLGTLLAGMILIAMVAFALTPIVGAQQAFTGDARKDQAYSIYTNYKQANAELQAAASQLKLYKGDVIHDVQGGVSGGAQVLTSGYAKDVAALKQKIAAMQSRMQTMEKTWDRIFFSAYGPLSDSLKSIVDPVSKKKIDPIQARLNYVSPKPANTSQSTAALTKPVWILKGPPVIYESAKDNMADYSIQQGSATRGGITASETVTLNKARPELRKGFLSWSFTNKSDMNSLIPGEKLKWNATVKDTSGVGSVLGNLKFEVFGMPGNRTSSGGDLFYESPANGSAISKSGEAVVPTGNLGDKILLRGKVTAGRCTIVYDDVYEFTNAATATATPATPPASAGKAQIANIFGNWQSEWGPVNLQSAGTSADGKIAIRGSWQQGAKGTGIIENGTYDHVSGTLKFTYYQPWNTTRGTATLIKSADGSRFSGSFSQPPSYTGAWTIYR